MGKRKGKQLSSKDLRHLKEFGEAHPADVEDAKKRQKLQNEKDLGISSRKIIKAKPRDPLAKLISVEKGEKFPEPEIPETNENEASEINLDVPITTCQVNEEASMQSMTQTNVFTSVLDKIFDKSGFREE